MTTPSPTRRAALALAALAAAAAVPRATAPAAAQSLDMTGGGPVEVTATDGIEWRQAEQVVVARGDARAIREGVTLEADRLIARYRDRAGTGQPAPAAQPANAAAPEAAGPLSGGAEIWRLEAEGRVRISTATERARADRAVYDMDQAVMVLTGRDLRLETPDNTLTARDSLEYWPARRMAVARGAAGVATSDGRRIAADTLVGYFLDDGQPRPRAANAAATGGAALAVQPPPAQPPPAGRPGARSPAAQQPPPLRAAPGEGSNLDRVEVFGNVEIRTQAEVVRGDRGVYSPRTGTARLLGNVRITRGGNQLNGGEAIVNLRSGVARLVSAPGQRVQGLVLPNSADPAGATQPPGGAARPAR